MCLIGNSVEIGYCSRSCNLNVLFRRLYHCLKKWEGVETEKVRRPANVFI